MNTFFLLGNCLELRKGKTQSHSAGSRVGMQDMLPHINGVRYIEFSVRGRLS